jgi:hypothetical protein
MKFYKALESLRNKYLSSKTPLTGLSTSHPMPNKTWNPLECIQISEDHSLLQKRIHIMTLSFVGSSPSSRQRRKFSLVKDTLSIQSWITNLVQIMIDQKVKE